jgi:hypothetical protein
VSLSLLKNLVSRNRKCHLELRSFSKGVSPYFSASFWKRVVWAGALFGALWGYVPSGKRPSDTLPFKRTSMQMTLHGEEAHGVHTPSIVGSGAKCLGDAVPHPHTLGALVLWEIELKVNCLVLEPVSPYHDGGLEQLLGEWKFLYTLVHSHKSSFPSPEFKPDSWIRVSARDSCCHTSVTLLL